MTDPGPTPTSGPRDDDERLVRYIAGECTPEESVRERTWIAADPARWARFLELERTWRAYAGEPSERWNAERALAELRRARGSSVTPSSGELSGARESVPHVAAPRAAFPGEYTPTGGRYLAGIARFTGMLAFVAVCVVGWRAIGGRWPTLSSRSDSGSTVPLQAVTTARGQRATITLADGSRIVLGAESSVRYARDFGARARRDVYLQGQAYFEVAHDTLHPFTVHTSRGIAEDLGTTFVVTAYADAADMEVVVQSGKVKLSAAGSAVADSARAAAMMQGRVAPPITLGPGELGRIDGSGVLSQGRVTDLSPYIGWTNGELEFRGVPLGDALPAIGRWYDVEIVLADTSLASRRLVASFGPHSAGDVVRLLALAVNARYEQRGDTIVFRGKQ